MSKGYIAGPMQGLPDHNYPAFKRTAELLRAAGKDVVSPTDRYNHVPPEPSTEYALEALKGSIIDLLSCEEMYLMEGWHESRGVALEILLAVIFKYPIQRLVLVNGVQLNRYRVIFTLTDAAKHFVRIWMVPS